MALHEDQISRFAKSLSGEVFSPGQEEFTKVTQDRWNLYTLQFKPTLIVRPKTVADIQATVLFGKQVKKHVVPRNGAHSFKSQQNDIIVLDMSNFKQVHVNQDTGVVVTGAGVTLGELDTATSPWHVPLGVVKSTGAVGLGLHGGVGFQDRQHGYTVDNILAAQIVTADGQYLTVSEKENSDLFWAIRGAGSSFGIVTEITLQAYRSDNVWCGALGLVFTRENLDFLLDFAEGVFTNTKCSFYVVITNAPDGSIKLALAVMVYYGSQEEAMKVYGPILEKNPIPVIPTANRTLNELNKLLDYPPAYWYLTGGSVPENITPELRSMLIEEWNSMPTTYLGGFVVEMRGGRGAEIPVSSTAGPGDRTHKFDLIIFIGTSDPKEAETLTDVVRKARDNLRIKNKSKAGLPLFNTSTNFHHDLKESFGENAERLLALKHKHDPENFFEGLINILPNKVFGSS